MKNTRIILFTLLLALPFASCKQKGCTDPLAENYNVDAQKSDGTCTYLSDKLIGTYSVEQECLYDGPLSYTMNVVAGSDKGEVILQGLSDSVVLRATIDGTIFEFNQDVLANRYEGSGYLVGSNVMMINMEVCEVYYYPCGGGTESCTLTCTK